MKIYLYLIKYLLTSLTLLLTNIYICGLSFLCGCCFVLAVLVVLFKCTDQKHSISFTLVSHWLTEHHIYSHYLSVFAVLLHYNSHT